MADVVSAQLVLRIGRVGDGGVVGSPLIAMGDYTVGVGFPLPVAHGERIAGPVRIASNARCDKVKHRTSPALVPHDDADAAPLHFCLQRLRLGALAVFETIGLIYCAV